jgi:hypothetical protein
MNTLEDRVTFCEQENARLRKRIGRQNGFWLIALLLAIGGSAIAGWSLKQVAFESIKAKEIAVVDANGTVRARLSGDLPDAIMANGRISKRGSKAAGVMLYDEEGIERGGYVTQDKDSNVMLTLDSKHRQATWLIAGPSEDQVSSLRLWNKDGAIELRSDESGQRLSISDKAGVRYQQPTVALHPATCTYFKDLEQKYPDEHACRAKYTETACQTCFDKK